MVAERAAGAASTRRRQSVVTAKPGRHKETAAGSVLDVYLPRWDHPHGGKALRDVPTPALTEIGVQLRDRGGDRYTLLVRAIANELERRKEEPA